MMGLARNALLLARQRGQTGTDLMLCYACVKTFRQLLGMFALLLLLLSHQQGQTGTDLMLCYARVTAISPTGPDKD